MFFVQIVVPSSLSLSLSCSSSKTLSYPQFLIAVQCIPSFPRTPLHSLAPPSHFTCFFTPVVAMACQLASFQGLRVLTSARVQQHQQQQHQLNSSQVSVAARRCLVRANSPTSAGGASGDAGAASSTTAKKKSSSILCQSCDGNGAVACSQCHGGGLNTEDHFNGRFKAGGTCWLCRGKRQMLCGNCNGAGFMGGFMNTQDE